MSSNDTVSQREAETWLDRYARHIVAQGVGLQRGQALFVRGQRRFHDFALRLGEVAYELGASRVVYRFGEPAVLDQLLRHGGTESQHLYHLDDRAWYRDLFQQRGRLVALSAAGVDRVRYPADSGRAVAHLDAELGLTAYELHRHSVGGRLAAHSIVPAPSLGWARHLFADQDEPTALASLARALAECCRLSEPAAADDFARRLDERARWLDALVLRKLRIEGGGNQLEIGLHPRARWRSCVVEPAEGRRFWINLPSEEVFTCPRAGEAEGMLRTSRPLILGDGKTIERLELRFEGGEVVDFDASSHGDIFARHLALDSGARRLGEVALVSDDSPMARFGRNFGHYLLDENAGCHVALGQCHAMTLADIPTGAPASALPKGANRSAIHLDLVFGGPEVIVSGETSDGEVVLLIDSGTWVPSADTESAHRLAPTRHS